MLKLPVLLPIEVGRKPTLMLQLPPAASDAPQVLLVITKLVLTLVLVMLNEVEPTLVRVTFLAALVELITCVAYAREVGESLSFVPLPLSATLCGLPPALSEMVRLPVTAPVAVGRKVRLMMQAMFGARVAPQVFDEIANFELATMLEIFSVVPPVFLRLTGLLADVVLMICAPKLKLVGLNETAGGVVFDPVPVRLTLCG